MVHKVFEALLAALCLKLLADTVEDDDRCVDRVTYDCKHTCDKCISYGHPRDHIEGKHNENIVDKRHYRAGSKADVFETEPDVEQHTDRSDNYRNDCVCPHLRAYSRTDIFSCDICCRNSVVLFHILCKIFTLIQIQRLRLEDNLVRSLNGLHLDVHISCDVLQIRNHLTVDLIQRIFFVEGYGRGRSADKVEAVVHRSDSARMVDAHEHEPAQAENDGDCEKDSAFSKEIDGLSLLELFAVYFPVPNAEGIEGIYDQSCDDKRREHGDHDTERQCLSESSDTSASSQPEHAGCDQRRHVSVDDC